VLQSLICLTVNPFGVCCENPDPTHFTQNVITVHPAATFYLAEIAQGVEPAMKKLALAFRVEEQVLSIKTHELTGQKVLSKFAKRSSQVAV